MFVTRGKLAWEMFFILLRCEKLHGWVFKSVSVWERNESYNSNKLNNKCQDIALKLFLYCHGISCIEVVHFLKCFIVLP